MKEPIDRFVDEMWNRYGEQAHGIALRQVAETEEGSRTFVSWQNIAKKLATKIQG